MKPETFTEDDKVVLQAMAEYPLKKGQMLVISPYMANVLLGRVLHDKPAGKLVYEKAEWNK